MLLGKNIVIMISVLFKWLIFLVVSVCKFFLAYQMMISENFCAIREGASFLSVCSVTNVTLNLLDSLPNWCILVLFQVNKLGGGGKLRFPPMCTIEPIYGSIYIAN